MQFLKPRTLFQQWLLSHAVKPGRARELYRRMFRPRGEAWAELLRRSGHFHSMGEGCTIQTNVTVTDPQLVSLGHNVHLTGCTLFCHDGSVAMVNEAFARKLDSVGPIVIGDHVFIGHGAIVLPGVRIGSRVIVAAGAVVARDIPDNSLVAGVPARVVKTLDEHVQDLALENQSLPWRELVEQRDGAYDAALEPTLLRLRKEHFFGPGTATTRPANGPGSADVPAKAKSRVATNG